MNTVGDREILFSESFIIPIGEEVSFAPPATGITIVMRFVSDAPASGKPETSWTFADKILRIIFKGWNNSLGTSLKMPSKLGTLGDGRPFGFNIMHIRPGDVHFVTIQIYAGGTYYP